MKFDFMPSYIKSLAKSAFHSQWGVAVLVTLFMGLFTLIDEMVTLVEQIAADGKSFVDLLGEDTVNRIIEIYKDNYKIILIVSLAIGLFMTILQYGECKVFVDIVEGKDARFSSVFDGLLYPVKSVVANIYIIILTVLWTFLFIIPGLVAAIKYSLTPYIIAENPEIPVTDAVDMSKHMMEGHKMDYFVLILSFIPWIILVTLTCGLASIYVTPYMNATYAQFYVMVRDEYNMGNEIVKEDKGLEE